MAKKGKKAGKRSKEKKHQGQPDKRPTKGRAAPTKTKPWNWKPIGALVGIASIAIGLVALIALRPRIEMSLLDNLDPSQPLSRPLRIHNTSYFPVSNINVAQYVVRLRDIGSVDMEMHDNLSISLEWGVSQLGMGESRTIIWNPNDVSSPSVFG